MPACLATTTHVGIVAYSSPGVPDPPVGPDRRARASRGGKGWRGNVRQQGLLWVSHASAMAPGLPQCSAFLGIGMQLAYPRGRRRRNPQSASHNPKEDFRFQPLLLLVSFPGALVPFVCIPQHKNLAGWVGNGWHAKDELGIGGAFHVSPAPFLSAWVLKRGTVNVRSAT